MNLSEELKQYEALALSKEHVAQLIRKAIGMFLVDLGKVEEMKLSESDKQLVRNGLHEALRKVMRRVVGETGLCDCHTSPADTGPFPALPATDAVQPSPGPWVFEANPLCVDGTPLIATLKDRDGKVVEGLIACNSPFLTDQGHANVAAVLAVPAMLAALREVAEQTSSLPADYEARAALLLNDLCDSVEGIASRTIAAATPIRRKPATPEGGVA